MRILPADGAAAIVLNVSNIQCHRAGQRVLHRRAGTAIGHVLRLDAAGLDLIISPAKCGCRRCPTNRRSTCRDFSSSASIRPCSVSGIDGCVASTSGLTQTRPIRRIVLHRIVWQLDHRSADWSHASRTWRTARCSRPAWLLDVERADLTRRHLPCCRPRLAGRGPPSSSRHLAADDVGRAGRRKRDH